MNFKSPAVLPDIYALPSYDGATEYYDASLSYTFEKNY